MAARWSTCLGGRGGTPFEERPARVVVAPVVEEGIDCELVHSGVEYAELCRRREYLQVRAR
jgi:hypothetical protein